MVEVDYVVKVILFVKLFSMLVVEMIPERRLCWNWGESAGNRWKLDFSAPTSQYNTWEWFSLILARNRFCGKAFGSASADSEAESAHIALPMTSRIPKRNIILGDSPTSKIPKCLFWFLAGFWNQTIGFLRFLERNRIQNPYQTGRTLNWRYF